MGRLCNGGFAKMKGKKILLGLLLAAVAALLCGCGTIVVEDSAPVYIGMHGQDGMYI